MANRSLVHFLLLALLSSVGLAACGDDAPAEQSASLPGSASDRSASDAAREDPSRANPSDVDARDPAPPRDAARDAPLPPPRADDRDAGWMLALDAGRDVLRDAGPRVGSEASVPTDRTLEQTIVVKAGSVFDGQGTRFRAGAALGDGSQAEDQKPLFKLESGAKLVNVVLGAPAADGIHVYGDAQLENIVWEDIGEDALTIKESGTVTLRGGSAQNGDDKVFQINAASTFRVENFKAKKAGKFIRQNGGTTFKVEVFIDGCDISEMDEAIFRTDSETSTISMINTRYSMIGDQLFMGVTEANITQRDNTAY